MLTSAAWILGHAAIWAALNWENYRRTQEPGWNTELTFIYFLGISAFRLGFIQLVYGFMLGIIMLPRQPGLAKGLFGGSVLVLILSIALLLWSQWFYEEMLPKIY